MILWLMGISGAGKTTLGEALAQELRAQGERVLVIDGDLVRDFFDRDLGYSREEREANIKRIMLAAHCTGETGAVVIVCNIFPFASLRALARRKLRDYHLVWLRRTHAAAAAADVKGIYAVVNGRQVVGGDIPFDDPDDADLVIDTDAEDAAASLARLRVFAAARREGGR